MISGYFSSSSAVENTFTVDCFFSALSCVHSGALSAMASAKYGTSFGSGLISRAFGMNSEYSSNGGIFIFAFSNNSVIIFFNSSVFRSSFFENSGKYLNISCSTIWGECNLNFSPKRIFLVAESFKKAAIITLASTINACMRQEPLFFNCFSCHSATPFFILLPISMTSSSVKVELFVISSSCFNSLSLFSLSSKKARVSALQFTSLKEFISSLSFSGTDNVIVALAKTNTSSVNNNIINNNIFNNFGGAKNAL